MKADNESDKFFNDAQNHLKALNAHCIVSSTDPKGYITHINDNFCLVSGYSRDEVIGKKHSFFNSGKHPKSFFKELWDTVSSGEVWQGNIRNKKKNGDFYWLATTIIPYLDPVTNKPYRYISVRTDITALKTAEENAIKSLNTKEKNRQFFMSLLEKLDVNTAVDSDPVNNLLLELFKQLPVKRLHLWSYNSAISLLSCSNYYSYNGQDLGMETIQHDQWNIEERNIQKPWYHLDKKIMQSFCGNKFDEYYDSCGIANQYIFPINTNNETQEFLVVENLETEIQQDLEEYLSLTRSVLVLINAARDQIEKQKTHLKLIDNEMSLTMSQNLANIGSWDWNIVTGDLFWSEKIAYLFGYQHSIPETTYENFINAVHPDDRENVEAAIEACIHDNVPYDIEHRVIWEDGSVHWLHESGGIIRDENKQPVRMLGVVRDITEKVLITNELIQARRSAESANQMKSEFLSRMSHELRTPLNSILGFAQLAKIQGFSQDQKTLNAFNEIIFSGKHLLSLIEDVLDFALVENRKVSLELEDVNLLDTLNDSIRITDVMREKHQMTLKLQPISQKGIIVKGNQKRLRQIMVNLLSNAYKYASHSDFVEVLLDIHSLKRHIRVSVIDQGPGIPVEDQHKLFEPFSRLGMEYSDVDGHGIGLCLCKEALHMMQGNIGCISDGQHGCEFWFELPYTELVN